MESLGAGAASYWNSPLVFCGVNSGRGTASLSISVVYFWKCSVRPSPFSELWDRAAYQQVPIFCVFLCNIWTACQSITVCPFANTHYSPDSADIASKTAETFETLVAEHFPLHSGFSPGLVDRETERKIFVSSRRLGKGQHVEQCLSVSHPHGSNLLMKRLSRLCVFLVNMMANTVNVHFSYPVIHTAKIQNFLGTYHQSIDLIQQKQHLWQACSSPQDTHSPLTGHAPLLLSPSLCTNPPAAWFHCEGAAWTSCRPCEGGTLGPCRCSPGWVRQARVQAVGWKARWKAGSPPCNWTGPVCAPYGWLHTAWACWAQSGGRRHRQTAGPCPPWRESPPAPCPPELQSSHCWSAWTSHA